MATIELLDGTMHYEVAGPADSPAPPVVFVHGFLVDSSLWSGVAGTLAGDGVRSYRLDLPLGSHRLAVGDAADQSPRGVARRIIAFLEALDLHDVTLVGNDTGGALCQFVLDTDASRVGRLVLTNCDAFDQFPPAPFDRLFALARRPGRIFAAMQPMRFTALRHSSQGYGALSANDLDPTLTRSWVTPTLTDRAIRRDTARFCAAVDPQELLALSGRLGAFSGPVLLVWGADDPFFTLAFAQHLQGCFAEARLVAVAGGRTFLPLDEPARVASEIRAFAAAPAPSS